MRKLLRQRGAGWIQSLRLRLRDPVREQTMRATFQEIQSWFREVHRIRLPHNINCFAQAAAFALRHNGVLDEQTQAIRAERDRLFGALAAMSGVWPYSGRASFILMRLPTGSSDACFAGLKAQGVLVKNLSGAHPLLTDCLRVTVGTPEENGIFLSALGGVL